MLMKKKNSKKILYISRTYLGSYFSAHYDILHPDPIYIKHQRQLLKYIHQLNYEILIKPHPNNIEETKKNLYNLNFLTFSFDNIKYLIKKKIDILIFDSIKTSAFYDVIGDNLPIVFIDLNEHKIRDKAKTFVKQRCGYVGTKVDKKNNIVLNMEVLSRQIKKSHLLINNKKFIQYIS